MHTAVFVCCRVKHAFLCMYSHQTRTPVSTQSTGSAHVYALCKGIHPHTKHSVFVRSLHVWKRLDFDTYCTVLVPPVHLWSQSLSRRMVDKVHCRPQPCSCQLRIVSIVFQSHRVPACKLQTHISLHGNKT